MRLWWWGPPKQGTWLCGEEWALLCGFEGGIALHRTTPHRTARHGTTPHHTTPHHAMSTPQHYPWAGCRVRSPPRQGPGTAYRRCTNSVGCPRALAQSTTPREQAPPSTDLQGPGNRSAIPPPLLLPITQPRRPRRPHTSPSPSHSSLTGPAPPSCPLLRSFPCSRLQRERGPPAPFRLGPKSVSRGPGAWQRSGVRDRVYRRPRAGNRQLPSMGSQSTPQITVFPVFLALNTRPPTPDSGRPRSARLAQRGTGGYSLVQVRKPRRVPGLLHAQVRVGPALQSTVRRRGG